MKGNDQKNNKENVSAKILCENVYTPEPSPIPRHPTQKVFVDLQLKLFYVSRVYS